MNDLIQSLPRGVFVFLVLLIALGFIFFSNPPQTPCQSQLESFQASQRPFLYLDPKRPLMQTTSFHKQYKICESSKSPGGCLELFNGLTQLVRDLDTVSQECVGDVAGEESAKKAIQASLELMIRLPWGEHGPAGSHERLGWLDSFHLKVFCELKGFYIKAEGVDTWNQFRDHLLLNLPQARSLGRDESWRRSIMSVPCESYR